MTLRKTVVVMALLGVCVLTILPLLFMFNTSLKSFADTLSLPGTFWPQKLHWENYTEVFRRFAFGRYFWNTCILTLGRVVGTLLSCSLAAWAFARFPCRWNNLVFAILLGTMMLPSQITAIPVFAMFVKLGFYNTYVPLVFPTWLACNAFCVFLLRQFFAAIPEDLINAARIDGAGELRILFCIGLPLCKPILWTVAIFTIIGSWNDYFWPLIYLNDENLYPVSLGLSYFMQSSQNASFGTEWNLLMAASMLTILPLAALFFVVQRHFIESVMSSALKQ